MNHEPCNGCHDLVQKPMNFDDVAIVCIKRNDYRIRFWYMSKDDAINLMNNSNFKIVDHYKFFSLYVKDG